METKYYYDGDEYDCEEDIDDIVDEEFNDDVDAILAEYILQVPGFGRKVMQCLWERGDGMAYEVYDDFMNKMKERYMKIEEVKEENETVLG